MEGLQADEIRVLGPLEIVREHEPVALRALKERQLLSALLVDAGKARSSDLLVNALWGAAPPASAAKLLQVYVSKLRKLLPESASIRRQGAGYALELEESVLDAARFEQLLAEGRDAARAGNHALAASLLGRALALWRGPAYGDLADAEFAHPEAARLEELRVAATEERIGAELELGRHAEVLPELLQLASANPLREHLQAHAMLALYRSGRQSEALDAFAATSRFMREELGLEPGAELRELERRVLQQDPTLAGASGVESVAGAFLPVPPNPLLGRERELREVGDLLRRDDVRLLVLTGAGGSGKTRLAIEVARQSSSAFANGAAFVGLASIRDPGLLVAAISSALGIEQLAGDPLATVTEALRPREFLLLLDNVEHLREGTPVLVEILSRAPRLTLFVTSRVVLHLSGEHVYPVEPLAEDAAIALFLERACEADARFDPASAAEQSIARICERLDGMPLAIELAAGRIRTRTPEELLSGLERHLPLLSGGPRDLPARQQTLRATLEWSIDLLNAQEQRDLSRLSVFAGGCTLEAAEVVCETTLERLASLVDHNLVVRTVVPYGSRFWMLETVRELAAEQLDRSGEADAVQRRHAELMLDLARSAHLTEDDDEPFEQSVALTERANLRAALDWAAEENALLALELAVALENFWSAHAPSEGARRIAELLEDEVEFPQLLRARALRVLAGSAHQEFAFDVADPAYAESLRIFTELGDARGAAAVRTRLAHRAARRGELDLAHALLDHSQRDARGRFPLIEAQNALLLGRLALADGELDDAEAYLNRSQELVADLSWAWYESVIRTELVHFALRRGDLDEAERQGRAALAIGVEEEYLLAAIQTVAGLARVALARGDLERAGLLWGAVSERGEHIWASPFMHWTSELLKEARPAFRSAVERGRQLELWESATYALEE